MKRKTQNSYIRNKTDKQTPTQTQLSLSCVVFFGYLDYSSLTSYNQETETAMLNAHNSLENAPKKGPNFHTHWL